MPDQKLAVEVGIVVEAWVRIGEAEGKWDRVPEMSGVGASRGGGIGIDINSCVSESCTNGTLFGCEGGVYCISD